MNPPDCAAAGAAGAAFCACCCGVVLRSTGFAVGAVWVGAGAHFVPYLDRLVHAEQAERPGHYRPRVRQGQAAAALLQRPVGQHQRPDHRGVGEPQPGQVHGQMRRTVGQLGGERLGQLGHGGEIRLPGQRQHRAGLAGGYRDIEQAHTVVITTRSVGVTTTGLPGRAPIARRANGTASGG